MTGFAFHKNLVFELAGVPARFHALPANGEVVIEFLTTGAMHVSTRTALLEQYANGQVKVNQPTGQASRGLVYSRPLADLSPDIRREVQRRLAYLEGISEEGAPIFTAERLRPVLKELAKRIGDPRPPGVTTVYRWYARYRAIKDPRALIPRPDRRGSTAPRQPDRLLELLNEATSEAFRSSPQASIVDISDRLEAKVARDNQMAVGGLLLRMPSRRTIYRLMDKVDAYDRSMLEEGKAAADRRFRLTRRGVRSTRILQRVEIDHTPLDLFIIDEKTWLPIGRPTLTVVIDHYSRMILGYYLSFSPPSAEAVVGALRHAILPKKKRQVLLKRLEWVNEWPCYGVFEEAFLDNGLEFHGTDLEGIALDLEIGLIFCPKRKPRFKGVVERVLKTINHHFLHQIPGATFARFHLRGDYDPEKHALLTLTEVTEVIEKWIVDIYHQDVHRGINDIPFKRWTQSAQLHEPKLPASLDTLKRRIGKTKSCKLRRDGVVVDNIRYSSPDLQRIMNRYGEGVEVRVVYDPEDMGEVLLWGPDDEEPISVLATDLEYAKGLTARQNAWIREQRRQQNKEGLNCVGLQEAKASITSTVEELMVSRSKRERRQSAVLKGGSSNRQVPATKSKTVSPKRKPSSSMQGRDASLGNSDVFEAVPILSPIVMSGPTRGGGHES
jgi:putative transposase